MAENNENMELENPEDITMILTLDNDEELECSIITILEVEGRDYIVLLPLEGDEAEEGEVFIYRYEEAEKGEPILSNIENDDEFEKVSDAFDEYLDSQEFDEIVTDNE